jgi:hypothetical protein
MHDRVIQQKSPLFILATRNKKLVMKEILNGIEKRKKTKGGLVIELPKFFSSTSVMLRHTTTSEWLLLNPWKKIKEMKGFGKGVFGDAVKYQRRLREEWDY